MISPFNFKRWNEMPKASYFGGSRTTRFVDRGYKIFCSNYIKKIKLFIGIFKLTSLEFDNHYGNSN